MKSIFLFLLIFVSFNVFPSSPIENFNTLILKNLFFTQKSFDSTTKSLTESNGNITRENSSIFINVNKPYRERYIVKNSSIEIYDFDCDGFISKVDISTILASLPVMNQVPGGDSGIGIEGKFTQEGGGLDNFE